ncbi:hypothetical protein OIV83_002794 [Microbotryomycetes sp. JL201]|nr:hypothetical protein OIV83_002794 [Microbotryomycetes sp. JL201]
MQSRSRSKSPPQRDRPRYQDSRQDRYKRGHGRAHDEEDRRRHPSRSPPGPLERYGSRNGRQDRLDRYHGYMEGDKGSVDRSGRQRRQDNGGHEGDGGWGQREQNDERQQRSTETGARRRDSRQQLPSQSQVVSDAGAAPQQYSYGRGTADDKDDKQLQTPAKPVEPNFAPSGALAAETKQVEQVSHELSSCTLRGVVLKYNEPPEARKPTKNWRLYCFKGREQVDLFHVHRQSAYLIGRDRIVADIPVDHPSTSKQHAVLQFRQVIERNEFGDTKTLTKPFIIDLESANGTTVNDESVPPSRFYELKSGDVMKLAFSTREYVLLVEN